MLVLDQTNSGDTVPVPVGESVQISLAENPGTGFRWTVTDSGAPACELTDEGLARAATKPGNPAQHSWTLKAVAAGECRISFVYRRPWEGEAPPARSFDVRIRIEPR